MKVMTACRAALLLAAALAGSSSALHAQRLIPDVRHFRSPLADPNSPRIFVGLLQTNLLETQGPEREPFVIEDPEDASSDVVAAVGIGAIFPLIELSDNVIMFADARVFSRFRIEYESRDDMGQDWFVGGGFEARRAAWSGRVAIMHRSSHLGDEFTAATGATRIEFGSEQLDLLLAYDVPNLVRVYGGGSWIFRSYLGWEPRLVELGVRDRGLVQVGADREWRPSTTSPLTVFGGIDVQAAERTEWDVGFGAALGIGVRAARSLRLMTRFYDGPSTMGEFFLTPERYFVLELVAEI
jgi:hypothetical protein